MGGGGRGENTGVPAFAPRTRTPHYRRAERDSKSSKKGGAISPKVLKRGKVGPVEGPADRGRYQK